jgi:hypothetical protein
MTTGRINQVAFLRDAASRASPANPIGRDGGSGRGRSSCVSRDNARIGQDRGKTPPCPHRVLHRGARAVTRGPRQPNRRARNTGARREVDPAPPRRRGARRDDGASEFHRSGYATQESHGTPKAITMLGLRMKRDRGKTVRCTSTEPVDPNDSKTTHAPSRTLSDDPARRTKARRAL